MKKTEHQALELRTAGLTGRPVIVGCDKGGTGKSIICRTLLEHVGSLDSNPRRAKVATRTGGRSGVRRTPEGG